MKTIQLLFAGTMIFSCSSQPDKVETKEAQCTEYACPMHPDKTAAAPGECPECHMTLTLATENKENDTTK